MKDYSKSIVQTGATIYGGFKLGQAVVNKVNTAVKSYQTNQIMNSVKISNINTSKLNQIVDNYSFVKNSPYTSMKSMISLDITNKIINPEKQGRHIVGNKNYIAGRSIFDGTLDDA